MRAGIVHELVVFLLVAVASDEREVDAGHFADKLFKGGKQCPDTLLAANFPYIYKMCAARFAQSVDGAKQPGVVTGPHDSDAVGFDSIDALDF